MSATAEPTTKFSLAHLVNQLMDETEILDPKELATHVLVAIPETERENLLLGLIERAIGDIQRKDKGARLNGAHDAHESRAYSAATRALLAVVVVAGERKTIGQCSSDDLDYLIGDLIDEIAERASRRDQYDKLRRAVRKHKAHTVNDLPRTVLTEALR